MINEENVFIEIKNFIYDYYGTKDFKFELTKDTRLFDDFGLDGDEAYEFFCEFKKYFKIDLSSFEFEDYFYSERDLISGILYAIFFNLIGKRDKLKRREITLNDLEKTVVNGKWIIPER